MNQKTDKIKMKDKLIEICAWHEIAKEGIVAEGNLYHCKYECEGKNIKCPDYIGTKLKKNESCNIL